MGLVEFCFLTQNCDTSRVQILSNILGLRSLKDSCVLIMIIEILSVVSLLVKMAQLF